MPKKNEIKSVTDIGAASGAPDMMYSVRDTFGLDTDWDVPGFLTAGANVPARDETYRFDHDTTLAILARLRA